MDSRTHLQKLVNLNLDFLGTEFLPLIDNSYARVSAQEVLERFKQTVVALTDDDATDKNQLGLIWGNLTSDPEIVESVRSALNEAISKIDDPIFNQGLKLLVVPVTKTLTAVTDQVKPDGDQLKAIWKEFVESPEFLAFLLSNIGWLIGKLVKDQNAKEWILRILKAFIK